MKTLSSVLLILLGVLCLTSCEQSLSCKRVQIQNLMQGTWSNEQDTLYINNNIVSMNDTIYEWYFSRDERHIIIPNCNDTIYCTNHYDNVEDGEINIIELDAAKLTIYGNINGYYSFHYYSRCSDLK